MIRKIAVLSLLLMYISTTAGFALTLHFCGLKVSNVGINRTAPKPCCPTESETKPDNCCKDEHIQIKISDEQQNIQPAKVPAVSNLDLLNLNQRISPFHVEAIRLSSKLRYGGPPILSQIPVSIQNCVFRI